MPSSTTRRVIILGLDGATLDLIRPWAEEGILPTFKKLISNGSWGPLRSIMPAVTPAAWSSFITGVNQGKHGIYDFTTRQDEAYEYDLVESTVRHAPSMWQLASQVGKRVIVYNVPVTYPPERINGVMVSGLMTPPGAKDAVYPPELQSELEPPPSGKTEAEKTSLARGQEAEFLHDILDAHAYNFRTARYLMNHQPWDLFVAEFQHTDTVAHYMWRHMENKGADLPEPMREAGANAIRTIYQDVDAKLGQLIQEAGKDAFVIVMSDHGHGRLDKYFAVNTWLLHKGYIRVKQDRATQLKYALYRNGLTPESIYRLGLRLGIGDKVWRTKDSRTVNAKRRVKRFLLSWDDIDWSLTTAYSLGYGGPIYINLKGREPQGSVVPGKEYDTLLERLTADLKSIQDPDTGKELLSEFYLGRDIYSGPYADRGPDLLFLPRDEVVSPSGHFEFNSNGWFRRTPRRSGTHRMDGILFFSGPGVKQGQRISGSSIMDIAPTVLALLGVPIPREMDGHLIEAALTRELQNELDVTYASSEGIQPELVPTMQMSAEEEEILVTRLRDLGYIA